MLCIVLCIKTLDSSHVGSSQLKTIACVLHMWARRRVIATFSADGYGIEYLHIKRGEIVSADIDSESHGWVCVVNSHNIQGLVPANYVVECSMETRADLCRPDSVLTCGNEIQHCCRPPLHVDLAVCRPADVTDHRPYQQLLDFFRHLLGSLLTVGKLLVANELKVSHNTTTAFSALEQAGDNYMSSVEHGFARDAFKNLGMTVGEPLSLACAAGLHSNVGLGPFFAEALGLLDHFHADLWNDELIAGTLEAIFGGLERKGHTCRVSVCL